MKLFHGSSVPDIKRFQLGIETAGEIQAEIDGIWLCTLETGAITHAQHVVGGHYSACDCFVYECWLDPDAVIADPMAHDLPLGCMEKLVSLYLPWHLRLAYMLGGGIRERLVCNMPWYALVSTMAARSDYRRQGANLKNVVIGICRSIGIDVLIRPSTIWTGLLLQNYDETFYGDVYLVLDSEKVRPIKVTKVG